MPISQQFLIGFSGIQWPEVLPDCYIDVISSGDYNIKYLYQIELLDPNK